MHRVDKYIQESESNYLKANAAILTLNNLGKSQKVPLQANFRGIQYLSSLLFLILVYGQTGQISQSFLLAYAEMPLPWC